MPDKIRKPKILFVADKWCAGNKKYGPSEWELGMQRSLESTGLADQEVFHFDDYFLKTGQKGDSALLQKISDYKPDLIYLITNKMPGSAFNVPEFATLDKIRNEFKVPVVAVWSDLEVPEQIKISQTILPYTVLSPATASMAAVARINRSGKYIYMWVPRDPRIFNDPGKSRDIDLSYVGSPRKERFAYIKYLLDRGIKVVYGGGEGQEHLTTEQYADRYQRSKITLSFSRAHNSHVVNARPFEAMACGTMLLEQESFELMKLYTPYVDYVPYSGKKDLLQKARYYLSHEEEREKIARSGQRKTQELYSAEKFWQIVIGRVLGPEAADLTKIPYTFAAKIPVENLARLSDYVTFKMKFLNYLCSSKTGFVVYKMLNYYFWRDKIRKQITALICALKPLTQKLLPEKLFAFVLKAKRRWLN